MFDFVAVSGTMRGRMIEWIDHLHEHFLTPAVVMRGRYRAPETPGASTRMWPEALTEFSYPTGAAWRAIGRLA
jgi:L-fuconate dehydratase